VVESNRCDPNLQRSVVRSERVSVELVATVACVVDFPAGSGVNPSWTLRGVTGAAMTGSEGRQMP
jgi:hypothetical protein